MKNETKKTDFEKMTRIEQLIWYFEMERDYGKTAMDNFTSKIAAGRAHDAFSYGSDAMKATATKHVIDSILAHVQAGLDKFGPAMDEIELLKSLVALATHHTFRAVRFPGRSTSPVSDFMDQLTAAAWAEYQEKLTSRYERACDREASSRTDEEQYEIYAAQVDELEDNMEGIRASINEDLKNAKAEATDKTGRRAQVSYLIRTEPKGN